MNFKSMCRPACACLILSISISSLSGVSAFTQSAVAEYRFPTQENPQIVISNAFTVSIVAWASNEVSITAEVSGASIRVDELRIKPGNNKLDITCEPLNPARKISLTLRVPAMSVLEIREQGNKIEIKRPAWQIAVVASPDSIQLNVPESSSLDMQEAPNAVEHRQIGPGGSMRIGIGQKRMGTGPPFVKVTAPATPIIVARGFIPPVSQGPRRPTIAATTIARRTSSMSRALRRSNPQLIRPQVDQPVSANLPDAEEGSVRLETHLVNLNVSATDNSDRAIPDLKQEDFSVYEDGIKQQISFFSPERAPFNLVLLIDLSGSMKGEIELIKETALHFLNVISDQDSLAIVTFSNDVTVVSQLTKDRDDLRESIEFMLPPTGGTAFYDALGYALVEVLRKVKGQRNAVIAITDGEDNILLSKLLQKTRPGEMRAPVSGSFLTFEELLDGATESDGLIYPLHLSPMQPQGIVHTDANPPPRMQSAIDARAELTEIATKQLRSLAEASGGRFYHANRIDDLKGVFDQVAAELRTIYSMAYTPTNLNYDGRFRRIRVQANRTDVVVRTRPGYYGR